MNRLSRAFFICTLGHSPIWRMPRSPGPCTLLSPDGARLRISPHNKISNAILLLWIVQYRYIHLYVLSQHTALPCFFCLDTRATCAAFTRHLCRAKPLRYVLFFPCIVAFHSCFLCFEQCGERSAVSWSAYRLQLHSSWRAEVSYLCPNKIRRVKLFVTRMRNVPRRGKMTKETTNHPSSRYVDIPFGNYARAYRQHESSICGAGRPQLTPEI